MQSINECCDKVKKDYLKFLNKEKISSDSLTVKITELKNVVISDGANHPLDQKK